MCCLLIKYMYIFYYLKIIDHPLSSGLKFIFNNSKTGRKDKSINRDIKIKSYLATRNYHRSQYHYG